MLKMSSFRSRHSSVVSLVTLCLKSLDGVRRRIEVEADLDIFDPGMTCFYFLVLQQLQPVLHEMPGEFSILTFCSKSAHSVCGTISFLTTVFILPDES